MTRFYIWLWLVVSSVASTIIADDYISKFMRFNRRNVGLKYTDMYKIYLVSHTTDSWALICLLRLNKVTNDLHVKQLKLVNRGKPL